MVMTSRERLDNQFAKQDFIETLERLCHTLEAARLGRLLRILRADIESQLSATQGRDPFWRFADSEIRTLQELRWNDHRMEDIREAGSYTLRKLREDLM